MDTIRLKIRDRLFTATLENNTSARALMSLLVKNDLILEMKDYANMEKVGSLGIELPRNDRQVVTEPGDLMLYQGTCFVIYYASNSWRLTRLGKIENMSREALLSALGKGNVTVTLSLR